MKSNMKKLVSIVVLFYMILAAIVIITLKPGTYPLEDILTKDEKRKLLDIEIKFQISVIDALKYSINTNKVYDEQSKLIPSGNVDINLLIQTYSDVINTYNELAITGTEQIKTLNPNQKELQPLRDTKNELVQEIKNHSHTLTLFYDELQAYKKEFENAIKENKSLPKPDPIYEQAKHVNDTLSILVTATGKVVSVLDTLKKDNINQEDWKRMLKKMERNIVGAIILCCILTIVSIRYIQRKTDS